MAENSNGMSTGAVVIIAIIVAILAGGGVYLYMNQEIEDQKASSEQQAEDLQNQVDTLEEERAKNLLEKAKDAADELINDTDETNETGTDETTTPDESTTTE